MREQMLEFAECMREHGIDMPDPVFGDDGGVDDRAGPRRQRPTDADERGRSRPPTRRAPRTAARDAIGADAEPAVPDD